MPSYGEPTWVGLFCAGLIFGVIVSFPKSWRSAHFGGAYYDSTTLWPCDFDLEQAGVREFAIHGRR